MEQTEIEKAAEEFALHPPNELGIYSTHLHQYMFCFKAGIEWALKQTKVIGSLKLPSDDEIEENGKEGGLRDNELQMYWEGAVWLRNYIQKQSSKVIGSGEGEKYKLALKEILDIQDQMETFYDTDIVIVEKINKIAKAALETQSSKAIDEEVPNKSYLKECIIEIFKGHSNGHNEDIDLYIPEHCFDTLADILIERCEEHFENEYIDEEVEEKKLLTDFMKWDCERRYGSSQQFEKGIEKIVSDYLKQEQK